MGDAEGKQEVKERIRHHKLVGYLVPDKIRANGEIPEVMELSVESTIHHLTRKDGGKLEEEVDEFFKAKTVDERLEELVDIMQVAQDIAYHMGVNAEELEARRAQKEAKMGNFRKGVFLVAAES